VRLDFGGQPDRGTAALVLQATCTRRSRRITLAELQAPRPLGVGTPRAVNALAIPLSVATPAARTAAITGTWTTPRSRGGFNGFAGCTR